MLSALIPTCHEEDGHWICQSRCLCSHGQGTITGTGPTRKAAYRAWVAKL